MKTDDLIEGLKILDKYRDKPGGYNIGAEHDIIYAYPTDRPLTAEDVRRMDELGWTQEGRVVDGEWKPEYYSAEESWAAYT
jgi:hypothetical protein